MKLNFCVFIVLNMGFFLLLKKIYIRSLNYYNFINYMHFITIYLCIHN